MYKIIACDLDETLLRRDKTISDEDKKNIAKLKEYGVKFVPASGRGYMSIDAQLKELGTFDAAGEYVISFNGGAITENKNHKLLHFQGIPFELAEELYRRGLNYDVCIHVYTKEKVYAYNFFQNEKDYVAGRMEVEEIFDKDIKFLQGQEIVKCLYANTDQDYLHKIENELQDIIGKVDSSYTSVSYSSNRYLEFNCNGVNKGAGLRKLAEILGVDMKDTIAIGDNFNDLAMIQDAGLGVGVANVAEGMKKDCDYICENSCENSAVSEVIKKFIFK